MNFKKIIKYGIISLLSLHVSFSYAEDYSKTNPFVKKYVYTNELQVQQDNNRKQASSNVTQNIKNNNDYFTSSIQNPINIKKNGKYSNLANNSHALNGCWDKAGMAYGVDPWLLFAIAKVESDFNHVATNKNVSKNGTVSIDLGMMQINTFWLPTLKKFGIEAKDLFEPCTSVFVGAWIVAQNIQRFGYNQDGIGAYNSPNNITIRRNYAKKVYAAYNELTRDFYANRKGQ